MSNYTNHFIEKPNFTKVPRKLFEEAAMEDAYFDDRTKKVGDDEGKNRSIIKKRNKMN